MKSFQTCLFLGASLLLLSGCAPAAPGTEPPLTTEPAVTAELPAPAPPPATPAPAASTEEAARLAQDAYEAFLSGDTSLLDPGDIDTWGLSSWADTVLVPGRLEYTCLDLDRDGVNELLIQQIDDPCSYNAVFHFQEGRLFCWQSDAVEMSCRDYPLQDGIMVRQYDFSGTCSYTLFRYRADGTTEDVMRLFAQEELIPETSTEPCPYYEVDGTSVSYARFQEQLNSLVTGRLLARSAWTAI